MPLHNLRQCGAYGAWLAVATLSYARQHFMQAVAARHVSRYENTSCECSISSRIPELPDLDGSVRVVSESGKAKSQASRESATTCGSTRFCREVGNS